MVKSYLSVINARVIIIASNTAFSEELLLLLLTSCFFTYNAETGFEESKINSLSEELTSLRKTVLALKNMDNRQNDLIGDLKERNTLQERRITELEAVQHRRDKVCEEMKVRREKTDNRLNRHFSPSLDTKNTAVKLLGKENHKERIVRSRNLHKNARNSGKPPYEKGVIAFYAQMSFIGVRPGVRHIFIFDKVRTNVGNIMVSLGPLLHQKREFTHLSGLLDCIKLSAQLN
ncbi:uncharacterized protein LOC134241156 [Saccostrea cucullata]|uniref:uncharacterized protein LOC134241156 n=1 Tax=Saccostrea cuccullata TaxID=36930 RepID=UPI002ED0BF9B